MRNQKLHRKEKNLNHVNGVTEEPLMGKRRHVRHASRHSGFMKTKVPVKEKKT